jgi:cell division protein FtsA
MTDDSVAVLDLGSTKVTCLAASLARDGRVEVDAVSSEDCRGVKKGVVVDLEATAEAARRAIRSVEEAVGGELGPLTLSVSGAHLEGWNVQGLTPIFPATRAITREDVMQVINHSRQVVLPPDREQVQALPREFRVDGQRGVERPIGMRGGQLSVQTYLVTGQMSHLRNAERAVELAGRESGPMVLSALASGLAVLSENERRQGAASLDIGGGVSDLAIFVDGAPAYTATIPVGGLLVTSDIGNLLRTSPEEAERLKRQSGSAQAEGIDEDESVDVLQVGQAMMRPLQRRVLAEIVESRMRELALYVAGHIEKSGLASQLPSGLVLTGGGSLLPGTTALFSEVLKGAPVRLGERLMVPDGVVSGSSGPVAGLSTALGMALFGLSGYEEELVPATPHAAQEWRTKVRMLWSLLGGRS